MSIDLRVPSDIPGLERKGSPCIGPKGGRFIVHPSVGPSGYAIYDDGTVAPAPRLRWLDLSDPTGRAHALHWLATQKVADVEGIADDMTGPIVDALYWAWAGWEEDTGAPLGWELNLWSVRFFFLNDDLFADLNHRDFETLSDGSRVLDAEALRRIVLHVAGREVPHG